MVQELSQLGTPASQIGAGFGRTLAEQLPEGIKQGRLSEAFSNLAKKGNTLQPLEQISYLTRTGLSPQEITQFLPFLQQQLARREYSDRGQQDQSTAVDQTSSSVLPPAQTPGFGPPGQTQNLSTYTIEAPQELIDQRATQLMEQQPNLYPSVESARTQAEKEDARRVAAERAFESRQVETRTGFKSMLENQLQKAGKGTYADIPGELQTIFENKALADVASGKSTPQQAINEYANQALDFAKTRQSLKNLGMSNKFTTSAKKTRSSLESLRKQYKDLDQLDLFSKDLVTFENMTTPYANFLAYPVSNNKEINNSLASLKNVRALSTGKEEKSAEFANKIGSKLSDNDSLLSIAVSLKNKGYNPDSFIEQIRRNYDENKIQLSKHQQEELGTVPNYNPSMGDLFLFARSGFEIPQEIP